MLLRDEKGCHRTMSSAEASENVMGQRTSDSVPLRSSPVSTHISSGVQGPSWRPEEWLNLARGRVRLESGSMDPARRGAHLGRSSMGEFLDYVEQMPGRRLTLDAVSRRQGLSRAVFTKRFRSCVGQSFHQYVIKRRVEMARRLLLDTPLSLAFIAEETGFCSASHFVDVFQALTGTTPARFRERSAREPMVESEILREAGVAGSYC